MGNTSETYDIVSARGPRDMRGPVAHVVCSSLCVPVEQGQLRRPDGAAGGEEVQVGHDVRVQQPVQLGQRDRPRLGDDHSPSRDAIFWQLSCLRRRKSSGSNTVVHHGLRFGTLTSLAYRRGSTPRLLSARKPRLCLEGRQSSPICTMYFLPRSHLLSVSKWRGSSSCSHGVSPPPLAHCSSRPWCTFRSAAAPAATTVPGAPMPVL